MRTSDFGELDSTLRDIAFSESLDGFLTLSNVEENIQLWDKSTGRAKRTKTLNSVHALRMAISTNDLLALITEKHVELRNLRSGNSRVLDHGGRLPPVHPDWEPTAFSHDDRFFALTGKDGSLRVWDLQHEGRSFVFNEAHRGTAGCVAFDPHRPIVATGGGDAKIHLWNVDTRKFVRTLDNHGHRSSVLSLAYSPDGRTLASASFDNTIKLWNLAKPNGKPRTITTHVGPVKSIRFSSSGRTLVTAGGDKSVRFFDVATAQTKGSLDMPHGVHRLAWSSDESVLATADYSLKGAIRFWRTE